MLLKFPFHKINLLFISLLYLFNLSCNTTEPINDSLTLSVEDVSCTEAWLSLKINNTNISAQISLFVNDVFKDSYSIANSDTTLYIDSLLPSKTYSCQIKGNSVTSNKLTITTLDTTSNSYTWQTFTFGGAASSYLNDVTIVDENNIWAVGNIFVYDSSGQVDQNIYNAVHWDGSKWELSRV